MDENIQKAELPSRIEAFLFSEGGTLTRKKLGQLLELKIEDLTPALTELESRLQDRGITTYKGAKGVRMLRGVTLKSPTKF